MLRVQHKSWAIFRNENAVSSLYEKSIFDNSYINIPMGSPIPIVWGSNGERCLHTENFSQKNQFGVGNEWHEATDTLRGFDVWDIFCIKKRVFVPLTENGDIFRIEKQKDIYQNKQEIFARLLGQAFLAATNICPRCQRWIWSSKSFFIGNADVVIKLPWPNFCA